MLLNMSRSWKLKIQALVNTGRGGGGGGGKGWENPNKVFSCISYCVNVYVLVFILHYDYEQY
jgi:hypothetical protein